MFDTVFCFGKGHLCIALAGNMSVFKLRHCDLVQPLIKCHYVGCLSLQRKLHLLKDRSGSNYIYTYTDAQKQKLDVLIKGI